MPTQNETEDLNKRLQCGDVLRAFLKKLVEHLDSPGPSPEKTAEYYQLAAEARALYSNLP